VTFQLYDSASRTKTEFIPLVPGKVSIYHCGLTVQSAPHLGHIRKEVVFDVLRRWLTYRGYEVTVIANVTDIDDKILAKSAENGVDWFAHAYRFERELHDAYAALGCIPPTYEPRATGHIPEMIELIAPLIERGHAYRAADGSGDVYFDVQSWPAYGELSHQRIADMEPAADADPRGKRDPRDFALWKGHKSDEPVTASWPAPWGRGRPGWHIECSAMAGKHLGDAFDIHGGGIDLRFPHHENELAQARAAGRDFARYWMHNAFVTMAGEKMSKSLGNGVDLGAQIDQFGVDAVRLTVVFAGPPEEDIDWADVSPASSLKFLQRAFRLATDVQTGPDADLAAGDKALRGVTHRTIAEITQLIEGGRYNVAVARVMELVNATRRAIDSGPGAGDPAVREATQFVAQALSLFAPYVAEEMWQALGLPPSIANRTWPEADASLTVEETTTMVVQVQGKVRAKLEVAASITEDEATEAALADANVQRALDGREVAKVITRLPKMISIVPA